MIGINILKHNWLSHYPVTIDIQKESFCGYETCKFEEPLLFLKPYGVFIRKSRICRKTEMSQSCVKSYSDCNTALIDVTNRSCSSLKRNKKG